MKHYKSSQSTSPGTSKVWTRLKSKNNTRLTMVGTAMQENISGSASAESLASTKQRLVLGISADIVISTYAISAYKWRSSFRILKLTMMTKRKRLF